MTGIGDFNDDLADRRSRLAVRSGISIIARSCFGHSAHTTDTIQVGIDPKSPIEEYLVCLLRNHGSHHRNAAIHGLLFSPISLALPSGQPDRGTAFFSDPDRTFFDDPPQSATGYRRFHRVHRGTAFERHERLGGATGPNSRNGIDLVNDTNYPLWPTMPLSCGTFVRVYHQ